MVFLDFSFATATRANWSSVRVFNGVCDRFQKVWDSIAQTPRITGTSCHNWPRGSICLVILEHNIHACCFAWSAHFTLNYSWFMPMWFPCSPHFTTESTMTIEMLLYFCDIFHIDKFIFACMNWAHLSIFSLACNTKFARLSRPSISSFVRLLSCLFLVQFASLWSWNIFPFTPRLISIFL